MAVAGALGAAVQADRLAGARPVHLRMGKQELICERTR